MKNQVVYLLFYALVCVSCFFSRPGASHQAGWEAMVPVEERRAKVSREMMERNVGRYQLTPTFVFDVHRDEDRLLVGITNQPTHRVYPISDTVWFYRVVDAALRFDEFKEGKAQTVTLLQNGIEQTAERISD